MPDVLLEETSPYGARRASLLRGHGDVYLYLEDMTGLHPSTTSAVWVANHRPAPPDGDLGDSDGAPPRMGASGTVHPDGSPPLDPRSRLVWFEEGDAVALVDDHGPLAVIPGWAGHDGFYGYSRYARGRSPLGWEMNADTRQALLAKINESEAHWDWRSRQGWSEVKAAGLGHLEARLGPRDAAWPIGATDIPELIASRHRLGDRDIWVTATTGLAAQRMAGVEEAVGETEGRSRVELAIARTEPDRVGADLLTGLAGIPFGRCTWLGEGHTVGGKLGAHPDFGADRYASLLTATPPHHPAQPVPDLSGHTVRGEPVTYLWVLVIDEQTFRLARDRDARSAVAHITASGGSWLRA